MQVLRKSGGESITLSDPAAVSEADGDYRWRFSIGGRAEAGTGAGDWRMTTGRHARSSA
jgi:hypothetical protein